MAKKLNVLKTIVLTALLMVFSASAMAVEVDPKTGARVTGGQVISVPKMSANELLKKVNAERGKIVMVNVFASWCPPCRKEVPELKALRESYSAEEVLILGISVDKSEPALHNFMNQLKFNYPVFVSAEGFEQAFEITAIPRFIIYDQSGKQVYNQEGLIKGVEVSSLLDKLLDK